MREVVLATRSTGKLRELRTMARNAGFEVLSLSDLGLAEHPEEEALEVFETFEENALAKARYFLPRAGGRPVIADDSGLCVDALGGGPGVRSKRWSGRPDLVGQALDDANNACLLAALRGRADRRARYVCAAVWCDGVAELVARGETTGYIAEERQGAQGFGYDPYFVSDELGCSFGLVSVAEKEIVSHRGRAFRALMARVAGR